jgi:hypothetical protein
VVGTILVLAASVGGAIALELYIFHHRSTPGGGCPTYSVPSTPPPDTITPPGKAPPQAGGGC